jgi:hypothetical protein|tara:strand:+ start:486 stop:686 length:201 start_codon:yes stop_codon:yes gene_type:complete
MVLSFRPNIEYALACMHDGQWFTFSDPDNKTYENIIILDDTKSKPTEEEVNTKLTELQTAWDNAND